MAEDKNDKIKEANQEYEYLTGDEELRRIAFWKRKYELDYNSGMANAERKGMKKGKIQMVKRMLKMNMDINQIAEITELTVEEIEKLRD